MRGSNGEVYSAPLRAAPKDDCMDRSPITFTVRLTQHDVFRANLWFFMQRYWWIVLLPVVAAVAGFLFLLATKGEASVNLFPLLVLILAWLLWICGRVYFGARSQFKQQKGLREPNRYTLSDAGIQIESDSSSERMDWSHIYRASENKRFFFLHLSQNLRYPIPKRALPDEETVAQLRQLIRAHVKGKVRLLG